MSVRSLLVVLGLALLGLLAAASIGYASYLVSRDSVGLPVTKLEDPQELVPRSRARAGLPTVSMRTSTAEERRDRRTTMTTGDRPREPGDDNSGRGSSGSGGSGSGSGHGSGGGGRGGDD